MKKSKFILFLHASARTNLLSSGIWKDFLEDKCENTMAISYSFWDMSEEERYSYLSEILDPSFDNHIIFFAGVGKGYREMTHKDLIKMFRSYNVPSIVFVSIDNIGRMLMGQRDSTANFLKKYKKFDTVYHYNPTEAKKYGFTYYPLVLHKFGDLVAEEAKEPKVFFCGGPKGREETLKQVACFLEKNNIKYEFLLAKTPPEDEAERKTYKDIKFISFIPYNEVIEKAQSATCLLSLLPSYGSMATAAFTEAILYNKKLLTTFPLLEEHPFYNKKYMKSFSNIYDIDPDFIRGMEKVDYNYKDEFSVEKFLQRVEKDHSFLRRKVKYVRRQLRFLQEVIVYIIKKILSFFSNNNKK